MGKGQRWLLHIQHKWQLLIVHPDQPGGLRSSDVVFCHNGGDIVPVEAHVLHEQVSVREGLMGRICRPGVTCGGIGDFRHIETGKNPHYPGNLLRLGGVDGFHKAVGNGGAQHTNHQGATVAEIIRIFGSSRGLVKSIHPRQRFANLFHLPHLLFL